jgi:hypothetical protein
VEPRVKKNQAPGFFRGPIHPLHCARGTSARTAIHSSHFLEGWLDMRDLSALVDHEEPLPRPACDQPQLASQNHQTKAQSFGPLAT